MAGVLENMRSLDKKEKNIEAGENLTSSTLSYTRTQFSNSAQYLEFERISEQRHEWLNGITTQVPNERRRHNLIKSNIVASCNEQLRKRTCETYGSNMRVKIRKTGLYTYPDIVIICGKPQLEDEKEDTLLNPTVLIEVLSPATEGYDRGNKFEHYRTIASLSDYLFSSAV